MSKETLSPIKQRCIERILSATPEQIERFTAYLREHPECIPKG